MVEDAGLMRIEAIEAAAAPGARAPADSQPSAEPRLFVHHLRHVQAARLASTLQAIFGGRGGFEPPGLGPSLSDQLRGTRIPPMTADTVAPRGAEPSQRGFTGQLRGEVQIVPDEGTNALVVRAIPEDWEVILQAVQALDLRPLQVLIEVLIAEVRQTRNLEVGVTGIATRDARGTTSAELKGLSTSDFVLSITRGGKIDIDAALSAMASRGSVRIISRPLVFAQNNREAKIMVGSERPFVQVFRSLPTDVAVRDQIVQYRDVGTSLTILPTVNPDDYVNLQVAQEVSTATSEQQFGAPVISTREATTHLFVRDGQTAVLGGLIDRQKDRSRTGIPLLSAIPVIGGLFGTTREDDVTSELFLFLTPHVVRTDEQLEELRRRVGEQSILDEKDRPERSVLTDSAKARAKKP